MNLSLSWSPAACRTRRRPRRSSRGVDLLIATPGRLIDLMEQGAADLGRIEIAVLDEADHMADLGFMPAVTRSWTPCPTGGQRLLFSATLDSAVDRLVKQLPERPGHARGRLRPGQCHHDGAHHLVSIAPAAQGCRLTAEIASRTGRTLIFVRTQRGADRVAEQLRAAGCWPGRCTAV